MGKTGWFVKGFTPSADLKCAMIFHSILTVLPAFCALAANVRVSVCMRILMATISAAVFLTAPALAEKTHLHDCQQSGRLWNRSLPGDRVSVRDGGHDRLLPRP